VRLLRDWLDTNSQKSGSKVILAADVGGPVETRVDRAVSILDQVGERIVAVKVNWHILLTDGVRGLRALKERCEELGLPLIADMKLNDIGTTNAEAAKILFSNGFEAVIANPFVGYEDGIRELLAEAKKMGKGVILLVYMSHEGAKEGYALQADGEKLYLRFARKTKEWGADGAIVSSRSPSVIREVRGVLAAEQLILSPGVGFQGGEPGEALAAGADYLIVGRSIVESKDPVGAVERLERSLRAPG
jgi:orotidine-5'-phosphate decarboxylase